MIGANTNFLLDYDGNVIGLSLIPTMGTAGVFLPGGTPVQSLAGLVNGESSDLPTAYVEGATNSVVTAGVPLSSYNNTISVLRLVPDGG